MNNLPKYKFTLVPIDLSNSQQHRSILSELFDIGDKEKIYSIDFEKYGVKVLYVWNTEQYNNSDEATIELRDDIIPSVCHFIKLLPTINQHNKVILEYNPAQNESIIVVGEGDKLLIANSYKSVDFSSAIYYLLEILRQNQLNPLQTVVNLCGQISLEDISYLEKYIKGAKVLPADYNNI